MIVLGMHNWNWKKKNKKIKYDNNNIIKDTKDRMVKTVFNDQVLDISFIYTQGESE